MVFCFVQKFFFRTTRKLEYFFFCRVNFFPPNLTLGYMTKTLNHIFFPPPKSEYFFQQHWESGIFFLEKNHNHPWKLNGPSLSLTDYILSWKNILMVSVSFYWLDTSNICSKYGWRYTTGTFNDVLRSLTNEIHFHNSWKTWTDHFVSQYIIFY